MDKIKQVFLTLWSNWLHAALLAVGTAAVLAAGEEIQKQLVTYFNGCDTFLCHMIGPSILGTIATWIAWFRQSPTQTK